MNFSRKDRRPPSNLDELIHQLIIEHPRLTVRAIAGKLWGEDKIESKEKRLYRQANPYDDNAYIKAVDLPRLIEILSEGLSPEEDEEFGGAAITIYLNKRAGRVCHRQAAPVVEMKDVVPILGSSIAKCGAFFEEAARILGTGDTNNLDVCRSRSYEARSSIITVDLAVEEVAARKRA